MIELVKMSPKGQLVVPKDIRDKEGFQPSDRFAPFPVKDGILFKRVRMPDVKAEFESLAKELQKQLKTVPKQTADEAVAWARKSS